MSYAKCNTADKTIRLCSGSDRATPDCCCIAAYGCVQRQLGIQLVTSKTGMVIG